MSDPSTRTSTSSTSSVLVPAHLRDLTEEELPEEHRGSVLSEIDKFRQTSAIREEDRKRREVELERIKVEQRREKLAEERRKLKEELNDPNTNGNINATGLGSADNDANSNSNSNSMDNLASNGQSKINGFVPSTSSNQNTNGNANTATNSNAERESIQTSMEKDELEEKKRKERRKTEAIGQGKEAERSYLHAERARLTHFERLQEVENKEKAMEESRRNGILKRSEAYENGKGDEYEEELFWVNRSTWRTQRQKVLARERELDALDRAEEEKELAIAAAETEKFLAQQAKEMKALAEEQRKAGILVQDKNMEPLKMKLNLAASASSNTGLNSNSNSNSNPNQTSSNSNASGNTPGSGAGVPSGTSGAGGKISSNPVLGEAAEDSLTASRRGKLTSIQLGDGLTPEERENKRRQAISKIEKELPGDRSDLFNMNPKWDWVDEEIINGKYRTQVDLGIEESVGERVAELTDAVLEKLRAKCKAREIVEVIEPVLAEESEAFVEQLWRSILADSLVSAAGLRA